MDQLLLRLFVALRPRFLELNVYAAAFVNYLPTPLVLLNGTEVHIALEAYNVSSVQFADEILVWERALAGTLDHGLQSVILRVHLLLPESSHILLHIQLNGAKILKINDQDPLCGCEWPMPTCWRLPSVWDASKWVRIDHIWQKNNCCR